MKSGPTNATVVAATCTGVSIAAAAIGWPGAALALATIAAAAALSVLRHLVNKDASR